MICPYCQKPAEVHLVPGRNDSEPEEKVRCYRCARERVADGRWMLMGKHCRRCAAFLWRITIHGRYGHVLYLWPDPTHVIARHFVLDTEGAMQPYCKGCAPAMGENPPHQPESGGEPIVLGPVIGYVDPVTRYARDYTPGYRTFLKAWLRDTAANEDNEIAALLAHWDADVAGLA